MTGPNTDSLKGRRILVVEDDAMIAMMVEDMLIDLGCHVVGPAASVAEALSLIAASEALAAALLDVNLDGKTAFPVADVLRARGVPLIFCTGYTEEMLRDVDRACAVLRKPYRPRDLAAALVAALPET